MGLLDRFRRKPKPESEAIQVPEAWAKERQVKHIPRSDEVITYEIRKSRKWHVPGLRMAKRVIAAILLIAHLIMSQFTLVAMPSLRLFFWVFIVHAFIFLDYLWKTRKREEVMP